MTFSLKINVSAEFYYKIRWTVRLYQLQYSSHQSWYSLAVNTRVFFNFCRDLSQNMIVTRNGLHASQLSCTVRKLFFMHYMWVIIRVLHDSKKYASNASCAAQESVFLCTACKLIALFCQRKIKAYNEKAPQQNVIKCLDMKKIIFCQVFTYPYSDRL